MARGTFGWVQGNDRGRKLVFLFLHVPQPGGKTTSPFIHLGKIEVALQRFSQTVLIYGR